MSQNDHSSHSHAEDDDSMKEIMPLIPIVLPVVGLSLIHI